MPWSMSDNVSLHPWILSYDSRPRLLMFLEMQSEGNAFLRLSLFTLTCHYYSYLTHVCLIAINLIIKISYLNIHILSSIRRQILWNSFCFVLLEYLCLVCTKSSDWKATVTSPSRQEARKRKKKMMDKSLKDVRRKGWSSKVAKHLRKEQTCVFNVECCFVMHLVM